MSDQNKNHPLRLFQYCPKCGSEKFVVNNFKSKKCLSCGFVYYFNPCSAVSCFIRNAGDELLIGRRGADPAKGTLDLIGGFTDSYETAEETVQREVKEETGLNVKKIKYLFSLPNIYIYSGFEVHTLDMFFECAVETFDGYEAQDDVSELMIIKPIELNPEEFGLQSVRKAVEIYKRSLM